MAMKSAKSVADKWAQRLGSSGEQIKAGVNAVTEAPTQAAARRAQAYLARIQEAVASGKYQQSLQAVSLQDWQKSMVDKAVNRITSGAISAAPKMQQFLEQFLPYEEEGRRMLAAMPRGDYEQNKQRALAMMDWNKKFKRSR